MAGAEIGGGEGQDFEGEAFGFDHYEAREGEADHGKPVVEGWVNVRRGFYMVESERGNLFERMFTSFCQARPAVTPGYKTDVEDKENGK